MENAKKKNILALPFDSSAYPREWKILSDAPKTVYAVGDISLLQARKLTVVGSRTTPVYALKLGERIAKELSGSLAIVTGTADGGDIAAIEGALSGGGKMICVLAGGFSAIPQANIELLREVARKGLVLSPHEYETPVRNFSYEYRNKLLAALGEGTLVLGAGAKSGALITAKYAENFQKPVFAFPYAPGAAAGEGCNALIKQGARLVENAEDIAERLGIDIRKEKPATALSADETKTLQALRELSDEHITQLAEKTGIPSFKLRAVLSALEVKGLAVSLGGNRYAPL